jgi:hypothetical protein
VHQLDKLKTPNQYEFSCFKKYLLVIWDKYNNILQSALYMYQDNNPYNMNQQDALFTFNLF